MAFNLDRHQKRRNLSVRKSGFWTCKLLELICFKKIKSVNRQDFCGFLAELADDTNGDLLPSLHREWMALVAVNSGESFFVDLDFQSLLGFLFCRGLGQIAQPFLPFVELVFVAAAEEDVAHDEVGAVVIVVHHPVGDVVDVAAFHFVFDGVVDVQAGNADQCIVGSG